MLIRTRPLTVQALNAEGALAWTIVAYLLAAAAFELVLALRHSIAPHGEGFVLLTALLAMLAGAVLVFRRVRPAGLFAPLRAQTVERV